MERESDFKKGIDKNLARKKRQQFSLNNRKYRRNENLRKKRTNVIFDENENMNDQIDYGSLEDVYYGLLSNDLSRMYESAKRFKRMISLKSSVNLEIKDQGVIKALLALMKDENPAVQIEAAWCITNITARTKEETEAIVDAGGIPVIVEALFSPTDYVREQAVWAVGNIAGEDTKYRNMILSLHGLQGILKSFETTSTKFFRNIVWCLSNISRGKHPRIEFEYVEIVYPYLILAIDNKDIEAVEDALWAVANLTDTSDEDLKYLIDETNFHRIADILSSGITNDKVILPAMRTIGNFASGSNEHTSAILTYPFVGIVADLMESSSDKILKEIGWFLSNVCASGPNGIQQIIDVNLHRQIIHYVRNSCLEVKRELAYTLMNITTEGTDEQIRVMCSCGYLEVYCELLLAEDTELVVFLLLALDKLLQRGHEYSERTHFENPYTAEIERVSGINYIEKLLDSINEDIYNASTKILTYFINVNTPSFNTDNPMHSTGEFLF